MREAASASNGVPIDRRPRLTRVDLHVHTRASSGSATGWLEALGVAESYSEPERVYDLAKERGMNLVAITDHDTIDGAMELAERGFDDVIVGEEITTRFADSGCLLHVLVWTLTPELHEEIGAFDLRNDAAALAHWLRERRLPHALAHPLFDINRKLCVRELERCALLFAGFEAMNGGHATAEHRAACLGFLQSFDADEAANSHGFQSLWPQRWLTAGSDDHGLLNIGRAWTAVEGRCDAHDFFRQLMNGAAMVGGRDANTESLAHQFICVASRFLLDPTVVGRPDESSVSRATRSIFNSLAPMTPVFRAGVDTSGGEETRHRMMASTSRRASAVAAGELPTSAHAYLQALSDPIAALQQGNALASLLASQAAYVVAAAQHQREQALLDELATPRRDRSPLHVCMFVDALDHVSGVSRFVFDVARHAQRAGHALTVFTCADPEANASWPANVRILAPVGSTPAPGYPGMQLGIPWAADLLRLGAESRPDVIHVSTPGPVGLIGALTALTLKLPLVGTHHTDLPAYARTLFGSDLLGLAARHALKALYGRFDRVLARSSPSKVQLEEMGVAPETITIMAPGIDVTQFNPDRRDPSIWRRFPGVSQSSVKALYVGRLSREKNLELLAATWSAARERLASSGAEAELLIVGEGPWSAELESRISACGGRLLGVHHGATLAALYASCDFLIFPSDTETLGQVVMEAHASGLPAIVSNRGGPSELVIGGVTGDVIAGGDQERWIDAIVRMATDENRRKAMSRAATERSNQFNFETTFDSFWRIHAEVANQPQTPARESGGVNVTPEFARRAARTITNAFS